MVWWRVLMLRREEPPRESWRLCRTSGARGRMWVSIRASRRFRARGRSAQRRTTGVWRGVWRWRTRLRSAISPAPIVAVWSRKRMRGGTDWRVALRRDRESEDGSDGVEPSRTFTIASRWEVVDTLDLEEFRHFAFEAWKNVFT